MIIFLEYGRECSKCKKQAGFKFTAFMANSLSVVPWSNKPYALVLVAELYHLNFNVLEVIDSSNIINGMWRYIRKVNEILANSKKEIGTFRFN